MLINGNYYKADGIDGIVMLRSHDTYTGKAQIKTLDGKFLEVSTDSLIPLVTIKTKVTGGVYETSALVTAR